MKKVTKLYSPEGKDFKVKVKGLSSVPRAQDDSDMQSNNDAEAPQPGYRYFTPQPDRKRPLLPPVPSTSTPAVHPKIREDDAQQSIKESFSKATALVDTNKGKKSNAGLLPPSLNPEHRPGTRPQFLTPQPTRHNSNLVDRTPSVNDGSPVGPDARPALKNEHLTFLNSSDSPDLSRSPSPHTPISPLAAPAHKTKKTASQHSLDSGLTTESSPSPSPNIPFLKEIFLSDRKSHRKLKRIVGALTGLVLGGFLFLGLYFGLEYSLVASIVMTIMATIIMSLTLAFSVRARCVAALMIPTLCTSRGRAAFLAIIVTLLLTGPIGNIYTNAKVTSNSLSCSAELAQNQTLLIRDVAREIFDVYVQTLMDSVRNLQEASATFQDAFQPVENALNEFLETLGNAKETVRDTASRCEQVINRAYEDCIQASNDGYRGCRNSLGRVPNFGNARLNEACNSFNNFRQEVCDNLGNTDVVCEVPTFVDNLLDRADRVIQKALNDILQLFNTDVDFESYWENRLNQSQTFDSIQAAIQQELEDSFSFLNLAFAVIDKILALSIVFLLIRSYQYHSKYHTKDNFDNCYITEEFKLLDERRQKSGLEPLLPLKKSERRQLINSSAVSLSKPEKGLFKLGLVTVLLHAVIATILIVADHGLFWLLSLISRHGRVRFEISGEGGTDLTIGGSGVLSPLIQSLFVAGFEATNEFNVSLDTERCLPNPVPPNEILSVGIGVLYLIALVMVLLQAYALRLRRRIASYFYPEREQERIQYLYNHTLQRRQNLFKLLKQRIRETKHEMEVKQRVSFIAYLSAKYPFWRRVFCWLGQEKRVCLGCADVDNGTFKSCGNPDCSGLYCRECLHEINSTCTLCQEIVAGSDLSRGVVEHRV
ncbi:DC-STAMP domain-containing protein 2-like isoform X2 [Acanthaster planci]|uniref:DC-STAMP domain-containing protein 2-like isoform X2 n=1 Tax=Acanthaster planci TaxID=133434 RepID=A0A8B7ZBI1_ACAPL|nr:DC-STAMP domain-containing protein 2-like isoform X2 [Acanthaster planci]